MYEDNINIANCRNVSNFQFVKKFTYSVYFRAGKMITNFNKQNNEKLKMKISMIVE